MVKTNILVDAIEPELNPGSKYLMVGEMPGKGEISNNKPFSPLPCDKRRAGYILNQSIKIHNLNRKNFSFKNVIDFYYESGLKLDLSTEINTQKYGNQLRQFINQQKENGFSWERIFLLGAEVKRLETIIEKNTMTNEIRCIPYPTNKISDFYLNESKNPFPVLSI